MKELAIWNKLTKDDKAILLDLGPNDKSLWWGYAIRNKEAPDKGDITLLRLLYAHITATGRANSSEKKWRRGLTAVLLLSGVAWFVDFLVNANQGGPTVKYLTDILLGVTYVGAGLWFFASTVSAED